MCVALSNTLLLMLIAQIQMPNNQSGVTRPGSRIKQDAHQAFGKMSRPEKNPKPTVTTNNRVG